MARPYGANARLAGQQAAGGDVGAGGGTAPLDRLITDIIPSLQGWCTEQKALRLAAAVLETHAQTSVELGVFAGRGLLALAMAHRHAGRGAAWGFDPWTAGAALEGTQDPANADWWSNIDLEWIYRGFVEAVLARGLLPWCNWARVKSDAAAALFADGSVQVLHQDSNHSEEVSCREVVLWRAKIAPGGYWFLDDTDWASVQRAKALIADSGFVLAEDYGKWAVFRRPVAAPSPG